MLFRSRVKCLFVLSFSIGAESDEGNPSDSCSLSNKATPSDVEGPFYISSAPLTDRIAPEEQLNDPTNRLIVEGWVVGRNCAPLGHVLVEPWYAGLPDSDGNMYSVGGSDFNYRGSLYTDDCGYYSYTQTFPAQYPARDIRHVHFKFTAFDNVTSELFTLTTQMYFEGFTPFKYRRFLEGRESQIVKLETLEGGVRKVMFNATMDIGGDETKLINGTCSSSNETKIPNVTSVESSTVAFQSSLSSSAFLAALAPLCTAITATLLVVAFW